MDYDDDGMALCDIGAVERQSDTTTAIKGLTASSRRPLLPALAGAVIVSLALGCIRRRMRTLKPSSTKYDHVAIIE